MRSRLLLLFFYLCLVGCVPIKKVVFLQKDDVKKKDLPKDTVVRTHRLAIREYHIQPLDILSINFETLSDDNDAFDFLDKLSPKQTGTIGGGSGGSNSTLLGILVNTEGAIEYPVLGKIKLEGLTIFDAEKVIRAAASLYVPDVVVRVRLLNFRFTILGEVNGEKTVNSTNTRLTMMEAVGLAGGLTELADRRNLKVLRQVGSTAEVFYVDLLDENYTESPFYYIQQNDVIIVPPLRQRTLRRYLTSNVAIFSSLVSVGLVIFTLTNYTKN